MKHKFSLCFRPVAVEAEGAVVVSHDHHVSYDDSVSTKVVPGGNNELVSSSTRESSSSSVSGRKNRKLIRRKRVAFKHFPSLFKAIVFPDPMKNIHQLELHLKSKGPVKNRKPFHVLESEPGKPETIPESKNQPEEKSAIDLLTWSSSSSTSESKTQRSSHEKPIASSSSWMSCFCTIVLALLATIFLGKIGAIVSISLGLSGFHWLIGYFRPPLDMMKSETAAAPRENLKKYDKDIDGDYYVAPQCRIL
nr:uncharacterized protein LOC109155741 isoform X1 [Ipomoea batatas]